MRLRALVAASVVLAFSAIGVGGCASDDVVAPVPEVSTEVAPAGLRRLRARQYTNSVRLMFGDAAAAAADPPDDIALSGFSAIGAAQIAVPPADLERYEASAFAVATAAVADRDAFESLLGCTPSALDDRACFETLIADSGRVAWRRELSEAELAPLTEIAVQAARTYGSFEDGAIFAISALMQAPDFLYIVELGDGTGGDTTPLTRTELVTRISFFLTDTTPTAVMLDAAQAGELDSASGRRALATELLQRPEAAATFRAFFSELYRLDRVESVPKNTDVFPEWTSALATDMRESLLVLLDDLVWTRDTDMRELLTADYAFINERLAPIYDLDPDALDLDAAAMRKVTLRPEQQRSGILGQAAFLSAGAIESRESAVKRGVFIRLFLLCENVPPPPPNVVVQLAEPQPGETMKQRLEAHQQAPACASCHASIDGLGYPLQIYDALGRYRTKENGQTIDTSGDVPGVGSFADVAELSQLLHDDPRVAACLVRNVYRHALGRAEEQGEEPTLSALAAAFADQGHRFQSLLIEIASSQAFGRVGPAK